ncbi:HNH endonuclease signature motif containing protein [Crateriforma conspicua]|uniref:HNH domain-containing protein n=1 Tax=Crateriforma conspicua TaxID=2527996 RepID=A0A5C5Y1S9_9PLAN|nr:HNH endonuclease signature motif containing protein [Crateriforma conspicua]TWT68581.1 hypothetical protein Pan14r_08280 [Crateriforma conspicua]
MISLPSFSVKENLKDCVTPKVKESFGTKFATVRKAVIADETKYQSLAPDLSGFASSACEESLAKKVEKLYENRMVSKTGSGRHNYDKILLLSPICPYCLERTSETLDHFLPKVSFKLLSITPLNLVPACDTCNRKKRDGDMSELDKQFIHPYFETLFGFRWLGAKVMGTGTDRPAVKFFVDRKEVPTRSLAFRIKHQFLALNLSRLYATQAGIEINSLRGSLQTVHQAVGSKGVRRELEELESQWSDSEDKVWKAAMYRALSRSKWYCSTGFANAK